ncbi:MAG: sensor histidine kinase [Oscillospiraceae bacterium]|jgi:two-component system sensor histidine kinase KdpD
MKYIFTRILIIAAALSLASGIGLALRNLHIPETNITIVYLLAVLAATVLAPGYVFGFIASISSAFLFNFLFTEPYFTFSTNAPNYIITFIIMTITAFITSSLASYAKTNERKAQTQEAETKALYTLTNLLTGATDMRDIAAIATDTISRVICEGSACLCFDEKGMPERFFVQQLSPAKQIRKDVSDFDAIVRHTRHVRAGTYVGPAFCDFPICGREAILGLIRIPREQARTLSEAQISLLHSMVESIGLAMDRFRSAQQRIRSREEAEQERYRGNLLRSISHDLRTPLSGILGTTEILADMTKPEDPRHVLIEGINKDALWLFSLVENVLSLTRLQGGKLVLHKQPEAVEEVLGSAVGYMSRRYPEYTIETRAPEELLVVPMDAKLINQVLVNLMDNAVKHTTPPGEIMITVVRDVKCHQAVFSVQDTGCGIAPYDLPHIFQMFYTSYARHADSKMGIGLGLAICESIIKAHGGTVSARNRADVKGAEFIFTLPLEAD